MKISRYIKNHQEVQKILLLTQDINTQTLSSALQALVLQCSPQAQLNSLKIKRRSLASPRGIRIQEIPRAYASLGLTAGCVKLEIRHEQGCRRVQSFCLTLVLKAVCDLAHTYVPTVSESLDAIYDNYMQQQILRCIYMQTLCNIYISFLIQILECGVPWKTAGDTREFWTIFPLDFFPDALNPQVSSCANDLSHYCQSSYRIIEWRQIYSEIQVYILKKK